MLYRMLKYLWKSLERLTAIFNPVNPRSYYDEIRINTISSFYDVLIINTHPHSFLQLRFNVAN